MLTASKLKDRLLMISGPNNAADTINYVYGAVWLRIVGNDMDRPLDFVRRILAAMRSLENRPEVVQLSFHYITQLDQILVNGFDQATDVEQIMTDFVDQLPKWSMDADFFIAAVSRNWPEYPAT